MIYAFYKKIEFILYLVIKIVYLISLKLKFYIKFLNKLNLYENIKEKVQKFLK